MHLLQEELRNFPKPLLLSLSLQLVIILKSHVCYPSVWAWGWGWPPGSQPTQLCPSELPPPPSLQGSLQSPGMGQRARDFVVVTTPSVPSCSVCVNVRCAPSYGKKQRWLNSGLLLSPTLPPKTRNEKLPAERRRQRKDRRILNPGHLRIDSQKSCGPCSDM